MCAANPHGFATHDAVFRIHAQSSTTEHAGDQSVGATLVPIPNTIVKPYSADGTPLARARESRPSPAPLRKAPDRNGRGLLRFRPASVTQSSHANHPGSQAHTISPAAHRYLSQMPRAGIVTVVGKPNAGKSTLLNRLIGEKLSIVSPKPQSTRNRIVGIRTVEDTQLIILDTPGLMNPRYALQEAMRRTALSALHDADAILYLVDSTAIPPAPASILPLTEVAGIDAEPRAPVVIGLNKSDLIADNRRAELLDLHPSSVAFSASTGDGLDALVARLSGLLPESPFLYPDDEISTQTVRFFTSELVRETALEHLDDEVPYSVACEIEEFRETQTPVYIRAVLHVERESQKRILIGAGGQRVRAIGAAARQKIEALLGNSVYLDLWVKVLPNWRRNLHALERFGYQRFEDRSR
jgi:GTPase